MWRRAWVLLLLLPAFATAHPGHGPEVVQVRDLPNRFDQSKVTVGTGDSVVWQWTGNVRNHSVTSHDGAFDSDPGEAPSQITHPRTTSSRTCSRRRAPTATTARCIPT